jgi:dipeptidase D
MDTQVSKILATFEQINTIPRQSKNEEQISNWLVDWAKSHNFEVKQDRALNVYIYVPATEGREYDPTVILQGHMDMVCEKTPESTHDFGKDAIKHITEDDWLRADNTTLGADNGIAIAISLVLATETTISHPALELFITVDEETGLIGANSLVKENLNGRVLLNLDSEDEGVFTIGCAGGRDVNVKQPLEVETEFTSYETYTIAVDGLQGGHSGVDIHKERANANIICARLLQYVYKDIPEIQLVSLFGGSAHNAIPRNAQAQIALPSLASEKLSTLIENVIPLLEAEHKPFEPTIKLSCIKSGETTKAYTSKATKTTIELINALPHGIAKMSSDIKGLVETSNNFATMDTDRDTLHICCSQRSSSIISLDWIVSKVESIATLAEVSFETGGGYPSWQPDTNSKLLALCKKVYKNHFGKEPLIEIIHAGLECGIIGMKIEDIDMISYGPTIQNPHSPQERLYVPSLIKIWELTKALLAEIK